MSESGATKSTLKPVKIHFHKADDVPVHHADGVWALPSGDNHCIVLKFYADYGPSPEFITMPVDSTGSLSLVPDEVKYKVDLKFYNMVREFQTGVVLSVGGARQLIHLLSQFVTNQDEAAGEKVEGTP